MKFRGGSKSKSKVPAGPASPASSTSSFISVGRLMEQRERPERATVNQIDDMDTLDEALDAMSLEETALDSAHSPDELFDAYTGAFSGARRQTTRFTPSSTHYILDASWSIESSPLAHRLHGSHQGLGLEKGEPGGVAQGPEGRGVGPHRQAETEERSKPIHSLHARRGRP